MLGVILPKTEDGYEVGVGDLVWCTSDPFTPVFITLIQPFTPKVVGGQEFTFWVDPRDDEGDYPADDNEVFRYQRNCLLAARRIAIGNLECSRASIERTRGEIFTIDKYLEELK